MKCNVFINKKLHDNLNSNGWELIYNYYKDGLKNKEVYPDGINAMLKYEHKSGLLIDILYKADNSHEATIIYADIAIRDCKARNLISVTKRIMAELK